MKKLAAAFRGKAANMMRPADAERFVRDVAPGEAVFIDEQGRLHTQQCVARQRHTPCIFEYVYFARPDSKIDNISVYRARMRMGDRLDGRRLVGVKSHREVERTQVRPRPLSRDAVPAAGGNLSHLPHAGSPGFL